MLAFLRRLAPVGLAGRGPDSTTITSCLSLILAQVAVGVLYRSAGDKGTQSNYPFSPPAAVAISDFLKLCISVTLLWREWRNAPESDKEQGSEEHRESLLGHIQKERWTELWDGPLWGYIQLALLYSFLNITIFISYKSADPASITLIKATVLPVLALNDLLCGQNTSKQWGAVAMQILAVIASQIYSDISPSTYLLIISQTLVSAVASIYAGHFNRGSLSPHMRNAIIYMIGITMGLLTHITSNLYLVDQPGFFAGYADTIPILIVNVLIGHANIRIQNSGPLYKSAATAISSIILLYLSTFFLYQTNLLIIPAAAFVIGTTYLYIDEEKQNTKLNILYNIPATAIQASITLCVITSLLISTANTPTTPSVEELTPIYSPFNHTLLMTRITRGDLIERIEPLQKYSPFFHTLHISKPPHPDVPEDPITNTTYSNFPGLHNVYTQVGDVITHILSSNDTSLANITGLFYHHFDFWLDPLAFTSMDFSKPWIMDRDGPTLHCMTNPAEYAMNWQGIEFKWYEIARRTNAYILSLDLGFKLDPAEFCAGWADAYYIPRSFFSDFAVLARIFAEREGGLDHEMAIATIFRILQRTRQRHRYVDVLEHIGDCWGGCCIGSGNEWDLMFHRCGHRLDWMNEGVVRAQQKRLTSQARLLKGWNSTKADGRVKDHDGMVKSWLRSEGMMNDGEKDLNDEEGYIDEEEEEE